MSIVQETRVTTANQYGPVLTLPHHVLICRPDGFSAFGEHPKSIKRGYSRAEECARSGNNSPRVPTWLRSTSSIQFGEPT